MAYKMTKDMVLANKPVLKGEYLFTGEIQYEVRCAFYEGSHRCSKEYDEEDWAECDCLDVNLINFSLFDSVTGKVYHPTKEEEQRIEKELFSAAEEDYLANGSWDAEEGEECA